MAGTHPIGDGPPLLYLPGLDGTGALLFAQEPGLAGRFRVHRARYRACRGATLDDLAGDALALLDGERAGPATVVAESFGGAVGLTLALRRPERVERLVLVNGFAHFRRRALLDAGIALGTRSPERVVRWIKRSLVLPGLVADGAPPSVYRRFYDATQHEPLDGYLGRLEVIRGLDLRGSLGEITCPTLVLAGSRDRLVSPAHARELADGIRGAELRVLEGIGHAALLHASLRLGDLVAAWARG